MSIEEANVIYPRFDENRQITKQVSFLAYFSNPDFELPKKQLFKNSLFYTQAGLDKISLSLPLDYVNEGSLIKFSNGSFTTRRFGSNFYIDIHGEYLRADLSLLFQIEEIVKILMYYSAELN